MLRLAVFVAFLAAAGYGAIQLPHLLGNSEDQEGQTSVFSVARRTLDDRVVNRGTVESQNTVFGKCELPGRSKITFILPEGSSVKTGDRVAEFETNETDQLIQQKEVEINDAKGKMAEAQQALEIQLNKNETDIATAKLEYELAVIDLEKYKLGTYVAEKADLERAITEASAELEKLRDEKNNIEILVKKGYRSPQQLREYQLREQQFGFAVERDKQKLKVLEDYEKKRQLTELDAKATENERKWKRSITTAAAEAKKAEAAVSSAESGVQILEQQLEELKQQREKCTLIATQDGIIAYANERWWDASERIREGTEMWSGRNVFYLPDMTRMQVKANVHESVVDRIKEGQKASIRLDAFSDRTLAGTVSSVAGMAASTYSSVQNYETIILIDELPSDLAIKPGMTAEVDISVGSYPDVIAVPVNAITEHFGQSYVYVQAGKQFERRHIVTGRMTHSFVEITEGLEEKEIVALDAYQRGLDDFSDAERSPDGVPSEQPATGTPS